MTQARVVRGFWTGGASAPKDAILVERKQERHIRTLIFRRDNVSIIAPRQSGKTTLLRALEREHRRHRPALYLSLEPLVGRDEQYYGKDKGGFGEDFRRHVKSALKQSGFKLGKIERWFEPRVYRLGDTFAALPKDMLLLIDEYSGVTVNSSRFLPVLRYAVSSSGVRESNLHVVLADLSHRSHYNTGATSPFNVAENITLMDFDEQETGQLVSQGFNMNQLGYDDTITQRIYYWTNGDPYLTQRLCILIVEMAFEQGRVTITAAEVDECARQIIENGSEVRWSTLGEYLQSRIDDDAKALLGDILGGAEKLFYRTTDEVDTLASYGLIVPSDRESGGGNCLVRNRMTETFLRRFLSI